MGSTVSSDCLKRAGIFEQELERCYVFYLQALALCPAVRTMCAARLRSAVESPNVCCADRDNDALSQDESATASKMSGSSLKEGLRLVLATAL